MKRWLFDFIRPSLCLFALATPTLTANARPIGYVEAAQSFQNTMSVAERLKLQVLIIAAGYSNGMPNENYSRRLFDAIENFQAENAFAADGRITPPEQRRLQEIATPLLNLWGFQKVTHPSRQVTIWVPLGLGLMATRNQFGLTYEDPQKRIQIDFTTVPNLAIEANFNALVGNLVKDGATIHYKVLKDGWLVISASTTNGVDWYLRYHQDGSNVTGFTLQWNNTHGNISAERIAVLMSASLWSEMTGAAMVEPPPVQEVSLPLRPAPTPSATATPAPSAPQPSQESAKVSSGTGFFVSANGDMITNAHVIENCSKTLVRTDDGSVIEARLVAKDTTNDLALLRIQKSSTKPANLRLSVRLGESIAAFGYPHSDLLATTGNFTTGNITALAGIGDDSRYLQISAPVQAGNSGGPLLDQNGDLVGVVSAKLNAVKVAMQSGDLPQNVNFAVKASIVASFLEANQVSFQAPPADQKALPPADIADVAKAISGFVLCRGATISN